MFLLLFIAALWSPAGKGLASWLMLVMFNCVFVSFPCGILGQVWYLTVSISDLCHLSYFEDLKDYINFGHLFNLKKSWQMLIRFSINLLVHSFK